MEKAWDLSPVSDNTNLMLRKAMEQILEENRNLMADLENFKAFVLEQLRQLAQYRVPYPVVYGPVTMPPYEVTSETHPKGPGYAFTQNCPMPGAVRS